MNPLKRLAHRIRGFLINPILQNIQEDQYPNAATQIQLQVAYRLSKELGHKLTNINEIGFKAFSQTDEDGILLYIFSIIGAATKKSVEICAGDGIECNTANLIINHGWHGLLVDGNETNVQKGITF